jgi:hypothetical protein
MNGKKCEGMANVAKEILSLGGNFAIKLPSFNSRDVIYQVKAAVLARLVLMSSLGHQARG